MAKEGQAKHPWERDETVFENELWLILDLRPLGSFQITSHNGGFAFTLLYEEWAEFVDVVRLLQTQPEAETEICRAARVEDADAAEWQFTMLYPDHTFMFFLAEAEWQALEEAVEYAADYPWSPLIYRVDAAQMREKVAEQRRWLAKKERRAGGRP